MFYLDILTRLYKLAKYIKTTLLLKSLVSVKFIYVFERKHILLTKAAFI